MGSGQSSQPPISPRTRRQANSANQPNSNSNNPVARPPSQSTAPSHSSAPTSPAPVVSGTQNPPDNPTTNPVPSNGTSQRPRPDPQPVSSEEHKNLSENTLSPTHSPPGPQTNPSHSNVSDSNQPNMNQSNSASRKTSEELELNPVPFSYWF
jgi:hypothetical protein